MSKNKQTADLGTGSIPKLMVKMAVPAVVAQVVNLLYNIVDRIYIGQGVGALALTGVGLCMPLMMFMNAFAMLAGSGGAPRAAIAMGRGDRNEADKIMSNSFSLLLLFSVGITVLYLLAAEPLLLMFGASADTLPYAMDYMNIISWGSVFTLLVMGLNPFLTAQGLSTVAMMTTVIGAVTNIVLDPIFIFGLGMGVRGAALATVMSQAVGALWVTYTLSRSKKSVLKITPAGMKLDGKIVAGTLALGVSGFVMVATESLLSISFNSSLQRYGGDLAVGSMTILTSCIQLAQMPASGIAQGCAPITSFNFGAGNHDRVKKCFYLQLAVAAGYTVLFWIAAMVMPQVFVQIFNKDAALVEHTVWAMRIYMAGVFSLGFQLTCQQSFVALGQAKVSLFMACLRKLILLIPLIFILPMFFENKVFAVFLAEPISDIIAALATTGTFFFRFDKILKEGTLR